MLTWISILEGGVDPKNAENLEIKSEKKIEVNQFFKKCLLWDE